MFFERRESAKSGPPQPLFGNDDVPPICAEYRHPARNFSILILAE